MTVREVLSVLEDAKKLRIGYSESCTEINPRDQIIAQAFGDYVVDRIYALAENSFEIDIAVRPVKEG